MPRMILGLSGSIERKVAQPYIHQEPEAAFEFFAPPLSDNLSLTFQLLIGYLFQCLLYGEKTKVMNRHPKTHYRQRLRLQPTALARGAGRLIHEPA